MNNTQLRQTLQSLRLSGLVSSLDLRLREARSNSLAHEEFLELILQDELNVRHQRMIERRTKVADFRERRTLDGFDFGFNPGIDRKQVYELATGRFLETAEDVLLVGPPGVGKSHLAQALGHELIKSGKTVLYRSIFDILADLRDDSQDVTHERTMKRYLKADLLIIDDMGIKQLPAKSGEYLFEIIMRRYEVRSTLMTSNRPLEEWGKLIGDVPAATAILDRFLHHATVIKIKGKSYRMKDAAARRAARNQELKGEGATPKTPPSSDLRATEGPARCAAACSRRSSLAPYARCRYTLLGSPEPAEGPACIL